MVNLAATVFPSNTIVPFCKLVKSTNTIISIWANTLLSNVLTPKNCISLFCGHQAIWWSGAAREISIRFPSTVWPTAYILTSIRFLDLNSRCILDTGLTFMFTKKETFWKLIKRNNTCNYLEVVISTIWTTKLYRWKTINVLRICNTVKMNVFGTKLTP